MALLTKEKTPPMPEQAPAVIEARRELERAIADQEKARGRRDALRRILSNPNAPPADKVRARLALPDAETEVELAEIAANEKQKIEAARLHEAVEAWRPVFENRYREALRALYDAFEKHVLPANEQARRVWLEAYQAGIELPPHFWPELLPTDNGGVESLLTFRRRTLQAEGWLL